MSSLKTLKKLAALAAAACIVTVSASCGGDEPAATTTSASAESPSEDSTTTTAETTTTKATTTIPKITTTTTTTLPPLEPLEEYAEYVAKNEDVKGWIQIDGTPIDYPCVQGPDNSYYLTHNSDGEEDENGAAFIDWMCQFTTRTRPANTIIYGHNMRTGPSFAKLTTYCPWYYTGYNRSGTNFSLQEYLTAPTITFDTVWEKGTYKVFAAMFVNTQTEHGDVFKYYKQRTINSEEEFLTYIGHIMDRSQFYTDVDLEYGDELLTLSTCYYPLTGVDSRFVVFARRVREGESPEVDTSKAYINYDPLYFTYWYQVYGGSWGGRKWDTSKVKGFDEYVASQDTTRAAVN